jgi:hypothetical protein
MISLGLLVITRTASKELAGGELSLKKWTPSTNETEVGHGTSKGAKEDWEGFK